MSHLNTENIARSTEEVEWHPLRPFLPENARILFLGSFPPQRKRWCMDFYYPNWTNDHWRIEGLVFHGDRDYFADTERRTFRLEAIEAHCKEQGLAFFDTATAVRRLHDNASDRFLEVVEATDVEALTASLPQLRAIVTTGEKATQTLCQQWQIATPPAVGSAVEVPGHRFVLHRLPSSSRAYPLSLEKKADAYRHMFKTYLE